jgi:hypothetical protein
MKPALGGRGNPPAANRRYSRLPAGATPAGSPSWRTADRLASNSDLQDINREFTLFCAIDISVLPPHHSGD